MRIFPRRFSLVIPGAVAIIAGFGSYRGIQAQRPAPLVERVEVIGNRRLTKEEILDHVKTKPGEVFSWNQVQLDLQSVLAMSVR